MKKKETMNRTFWVHVSHHVVLGYTYEAAGQYNEAIAELQEPIRLRGDNTSDKCYLGYSLAKAGRRAEAERAYTAHDLQCSSSALIQTSILFVQNLVFRNSFANSVCRCDFFGSFPTLPVLED